MRLINIGQKKPKKRINKIVFLVFLLGGFLFLKQAEFSFGQKEVDDYVYQFEQYLKVYDKFKTARDEYLNYQTLNAKNEATQKTKELILQRFQVLRTYFLALQQKLKTSPGVVGSVQREFLISNLDKEIIWLDKQREEVLKISPLSLEELFIISDRFEEKKDDFLLLSYESLISLLSGKMRDLHSQSVAITNILTEEISQYSATESAQLREWLREIENKNYLCQKQIELVEEQQKLLKDQKGEEQMVKIFSEAKVILEKAKEYLLQAAYFQKEVWEKIKNDRNF